VTRHVRRRSSHLGHRLFAVVVVGALVLTACGSGAGSGGSNRPTPPSITASVPDRTGETATAPPAATTTVTSTLSPLRSPGNATVVITPAPSPEAAPETASESKGNAGPWIILAAVILLGVLGGMLISRSRRKASLRARAAKLTADTRTVMDSSVAQVLAVTDARSRSVSWPAVDSQLVTLQAGWAGLAADSSTADKQRFESIRRGIGELLVATRAENDALLQGLDWTLLRPRVDQERTAITSLLVQLPAPDKP
jgi:hypothetical protein